MHISMLSLCVYYDLYGYTSVDNLLFHSICLCSESRYVSKQKEGPVVAVVVD